MCSVNLQPCVHHNNVSYGGVHIKATCVCVCVCVINIGTILVTNMTCGFHSRSPGHSKEKHSWSLFCTLIPAGEHGNSVEPYLCLKELRHFRGGILILLQNSLQKINLWKLSHLVKGNDVEVHKY